MGSLMIKPNLESSDQLSWRAPWSSRTGTSSLFLRRLLVPQRPSEGHWGTGDNLAFPKPCRRFALGWFRESGEAEGQLEPWAGQGGAGKQAEPQEAAEGPQGARGGFEGGR